MTAGQSALEPRSFRGGKRRRHYPWFPAVHWHIDFLVALPSVQDLLFCAKHLFVAAMVAGVHLGSRGTGKLEHDRRAVRVRTREGAGESKLPPSLPVVV